MTQPELITYFTEWGIYDRKYTVANFPFRKSSLAFAFADVTADGHLKVYDPWATLQKPFSDNPSIQPDSWNDGGDENSRGIFGQFRKMKAAGVPFKAYLSCGGWTLSRNFSTVFRSKTLSETFANDVVDWLKKYDWFQGISFDYEYPSDTSTVSYGLETNAVALGDGARFVEFLALMRSKLPPGKKMDICCSMDPKKLDWDIGKASTYLDYVSVMTYVSISFFFDLLKITKKYVN